MKCSGMGAAWIRKNHHMYLVANSWLVCRYIVNVGAMSMRQTFGDVFGKVETQAMGDASTPIVGAHKELLVPKMTHRLDLVQRHCAERIIDVAISVGWAARIPVSSQIGR